ncbi:hypothetical protein [Actomonas aquatica]|uniref:Uncharacterized protein n=1 Tax=Actomonas aquatica TaxID=2866162 RepID=A0ABZ1C584_9BACT|nr:hypothetical protein [Opitutus sp. WL0086]WRQ86892.1 hypothetical protein K1X11_018930 [Opitutus sp. WL0086]
MSPITEIDHLLIEIASPLAREADTILDLRAAASADPHPGRCVSCYFKLLAAAPADLTPRFTPLRRWLEARIEITATDDQRQTLLEVLPLQLDDADLESCCRRAMNHIFEDRAYPQSSEIGLRFRFRSATPTSPVASSAAA